eukprot:m.309267 g.309267  ORF g.309267 m.309267 type:complete len:1006 (-) comp22779_c0_seq1:116-3133(-)
MRSGTLAAELLQGPSKGDAVCLRSEDESQAPLSYTALAAFVESAPFPPWMCGPGKFVATALPNGPETAVLYLALSARACIVPLSLAEPPAAAHRALDDLRPSALVVFKGSEDDAAAPAVSAARSLGVPVVAVVPRAPESSRDGHSDGQGEDARRSSFPASSSVPIGLFDLKVISDAPDGGCESGADWRGPDDAAMLLQTSGTTKRPKWVPLTHQNLLAGAAAMASTLRLAPQDICVCLLPLTHLHGMALHLFSNMHAGGSTIVPRRFRGGEWLFDLLQKHSVSWYSAVPTLHLQILEYAEAFMRAQGGGANSRPCHCLRFVRNCSAALLPTVVQRLEAALGCRVVPTYGMTECLPICSNSLDGPRKTGSVGPAAGPSVCILREDFSKCSALEEGQVAATGPFVTPGYLLRPYMTENPNDEAFHTDSTGARWLLTGDKGYMDEDGHVFLTGRFKEIINRGGETLSPFAIEDAVLQHPLVADCVAFSVDHIELGEAVGVAAVLRPGASSLDLAALRSFLVAEGLLASMHLPLVLVLLPTLVLGVTGKPRRIGLANILGVPAATVPQTFVAKRLAHPDPVSPLSWSLATLNLHSACTSITEDDNKDPLAVLRVRLRTLAAQLLCVESLNDSDNLWDCGLDSMLAIALSEAIIAEYPPLVDNPNEKNDNDDDIYLLDIHPSVDALVAYLSPRVSQSEPATDGTCKVDAAPPPAPTEEQTASEGSAERQRGRRKKKGPPPSVENSNHPQSGLHCAKTGKLAALRALHAQGWDPIQAADKHGTGPLEWAAGSGHLDVTLWLLREAGVDVNRTNKEGRTALMWACRNGHLEVARALVAAGGSVRAVTRKGVSCLHWAVYGQSRPVSEWLLDEHGLDLEFLSNAGCNAAVWAAAAGSVSLCQWLHSRGADFARLNYWGHGAVVKAAWKGHVELLEWLFKACPAVHRHLFYLNHIGEAPVDVAVQARRTAAVELLVAQMMREPLPFAPAPLIDSPVVHQHKLQAMDGKMHMKDM